MREVFEIFGYAITVTDVILFCLFFLTLSAASTVVSLLSKIAEHMGKTETIVSVLVRISGNTGLTMQYVDELRQCSYLTPEELRAYVTAKKLYKETGDARYLRESLKYFRP